jgi:ferredoxin
LTSAALPDDSVDCGYRNGYIPKLKVTLAQAPGLAIRRSAGDPTTCAGRKGAAVKVRVDADKCQGHTLCWLAAPEAFVLDDVDGHSSAVSETVPPELEASVTEAVHSCPEQAIEVLA